LFARSNLEYEILAFDVTEVVQRCHEWVSEEWPHRIRCENADSIHLHYVLRLSGEGRGEKTARQGAEERSPVDHSIT